MSSVITVAMSQLRGVVSILHNLVPRGESAMPVGMFVEDCTLTVTCLQGCSYQAAIPVDGTGVIVNTSILYRDLSPLLSSSNDVDIEFDNSGVEFRNVDFSARFKRSYSTVTKQPEPTGNFNQITSNIYWAGLNKISKLGLEKMYNLPSPITVFDGIAIQKYPNTWVQTRADGLPMSGSLDGQHVKLLLSFGALSINTDDPGVIAVRNKNAVMRIPYKPSNSSDNITGLLNNMEPICRFNGKSYLDRLRSMFKFATKEFCQIVIYDGGIMTKTMSDGTEVAIKIGNTESKVQGVIQLPVQLWLLLLKSIEDETAELLLGGSKICLRTVSLIIVTHVLN